MSKRIEEVDYAKRYVDRYYELGLGRGYFPLRQIIVGVVISLILGLLLNVYPINSLMITYSIIGGISMTILLSLTILSLAIPSPLGIYVGEDSSVKEPWGKGSRREDLFSAFGMNKYDDKVCRYLKSIVRKRGGIVRKIIPLSWIFPISAFAIGIIGLNDGYITLAKTIYPVCFFVAWFIISICLGADSGNKGLMKIAGYACPQCNTVNSHKGYTEYGAVERYNELVHSKVGERTVGSVYLDNEKVGSVTETYVSQTWEKGYRQDSTTTYYCTCCGHTYSTYHTKKWDVERY